jgi:hypothetical protein
LFSVWNLNITVTFLVD